MLFTVLKAATSALIAMTASPLSKGIYESTVRPFLWKTGFLKKGKAYYREYPDEDPNKLRRWKRKTLRKLGWLA